MPTPAGGARRARRRGLAARSGSARSASRSRAVLAGAATLPGVAGTTATSGSGIGEPGGVRRSARLVAARARPLRVAADGGRRARSLRRGGWDIGRPATRALRGGVLGDHRVPVNLRVLAHRRPAGAWCSTRRRACTFAAGAALFLGAAAVILRCRPHPGPPAQPYTPPCRRSARRRARGGRQVVAGAGPRVPWRRSNRTAATRSPRRPHAAVADGGVGAEVGQHVEQQRAARPPRAAARAARPARREIAARCTRAASIAAFAARGQRDPARAGVVRVGPALT